MMGLTTESMKNERQRRSRGVKSARAYMCVCIYLCTSPFLLSSSRVYTNLYIRIPYVFVRMYVCMRARPITTCAAKICICINANARVTVERDDGVNRCTLVIGTDRGVCLCVACVGFLEEKWIRMRGIGLETRSCLR